MRLSSNISRRSVVKLAGLGLVGGLLVGCQQQEDAPADQTAQDAPDEATQTEAGASDVEAVPMRIASLKGPTSIGLVWLMNEAQTGTSHAEYDFTVATAADEIIPSVIKGDLDVALLPANAAAVVYNKTEGGVSVVDINTLGVLNVVTGDDSIRDLADLADKTIYLTGKGTVPEYTMNFLLEQAGIADTVTLEFKDEPTEVVAVLSNDEKAVGVLPQPFATVATTKNEGLSIALDLTEAWEDNVEDGSQMVTGVTIVRNEFLDANPGAVDEFVRAQGESVAQANDDPAAVAPLVVEAGIIDNEAIAAKAIPGCHLVCTTGDDMRMALSGYLQKLFDTDPTSVGGQLPADDFYYLG